MTATANERLGFHYKHQELITSITDRLEVMRDTYRENAVPPLTGNTSERGIAKWSSLLLNHAISKGDLDLLLAIHKFLGEEPWISAYIVQATFTALRTAGHEEVFPLLSTDRMRRSKAFDNGFIKAGFGYGQITRWGEVETEVKLLRAASIMGDQDTADFINEDINSLRKMMMDFGVDTAASLDEVLGTLMQINPPLRDGVL